MKGTIKDYVYFLEVLNNDKTHTWIVINDMLHYMFKGDSINKFELPKHFEDVKKIVKEIYCDTSNFLFMNDIDRKATALFYKTGIKENFIFDHRWVNDGLNIFFHKGLEVFVCNINEIALKYENN
jgi:hypothetical protein